MLEKFAAQKKWLPSLMLVSRANDRKAALWAVKVLRLFWCLMRGKSESQKLALVHEVRAAFERKERSFKVNVLAVGDCELYREQKCRTGDCRPQKGCDWQ